MTEQQPYEVVDRRDGFELRRYPAHLVAEIEVNGSFDEAPNRAFRPLAGFINGANRTRRQIAMTAPVTQQEASPEKIAMTPPVMQQATGRPGSYLVQFVMPSHFTTQTLPAPTMPGYGPGRSRSSWRQRCGSPAGGHVTGSRNARRCSTRPSSRQASARPDQCVMPASTRPGRLGSSAGTRSFNPSRSNCEAAAVPRHGPGGHGQRPRAVAGSKPAPGRRSGTHRIMRG